MIGVKTRDWFSDYLTNTDDKADFQDTHGVIVWRCDGKSTPEQYQEETSNRLLVRGFFTGIVGIYRIFLTVNDRIFKKKWTVQDSNL